MATRRARFKPVLNQPARRGRSGALEGQSGETVKDSVSTPDKTDKNSTTPNQTLSTAKHDVVSSSIVKSPPPCGTEKTPSDSTVQKASHQDGATVAADESSKESSPAKEPSVQHYRLVR